MASGKVEDMDFKVLRPLHKYSSKASMSHLSESSSPVQAKGNGTTLEWGLENNGSPGTGQLHGESQKEGRGPQFQDPFFT